MEAVKVNDISQATMRLIVNDEMFFTYEGDSGALSW